MFAVPARGRDPGENGFLIPRIALRGSGASDYHERFSVLGPPPFALSVAAAESKGHHTGGITSFCITREKPLRAVTLALLPDLDDAWWAAYRDKLERTAKMSKEAEKLGTE